MNDADRMKCTRLSGRMASHAEFLRKEDDPISPRGHSIFAEALADICEAQALLLQRAGEAR